VLLILDPTIWHFANVLLGFQEGGTIVFNSPRDPAELDRELKDGVHGYRPAASEFRVITVDATGIAMEILGRPITNTSMMGAFVGATGILDMDSVARVLSERFGAKADLNVKAAKAAAKRIRVLGD
jgi:pyruvate ferredoxin oxidoreductase gamma subunit